MDVLIIGSGGREHALVWKIAQSPRVGKIYCAPGNAGTAERAENVAIAPSDTEGLLTFAMTRKIALTVVGPEDPLVNGIVDRFREEGLRIFGPTAGAARLEGSKAFSKEFMARYGIPTAAYRTFTDVVSTLSYVSNVGAPIVVKASGPAAGKGAVVCMSLEEAKSTVVDMFRGRFGDAGKTVVVEEFMEGEEASLLVFSDGENILPLESAQDHKRAYDGDTGPNTGGMGAYSPAPVMTPEMTREVIERIVRPTVNGMAFEGSPYKGILYCGLMITGEGPKVVEYNCRFGDPEIQAVIPRLKNDIVDLMEATIDGDLAGMELEWDPRPVVCVVMTSKGYPGSYGKGLAISGLPGKGEVVVFHAGTARDPDGGLVTSGGRVLGVTAMGSDLGEAVDRAYTAVRGISWDGAFYRKDIAHRSLDR